MIFISWDAKDASRFTTVLFSSVLKRVSFETCFNKRLIKSEFYQGWKEIGVVPYRRSTAIQARSALQPLHPMEASWRRDQTTRPCGCGVSRQGKRSPRSTTIQTRSALWSFHPMETSWTQANRKQPTVLNLAHSIQSMNQIIG
jgi:hypothetical protein